MKIEKLSPSSINLFYSCPKRWYFERTGRLGIPVDERALLFGKFVHNVIQNFFTRLVGRPSPIEIERKLTELFDSGFDDEMLVGYTDKKQRVLKGLINFEKLRLKNWRVYAPTFVERRIEGNIKGIKASGIIDFYGQVDGIVIDWKTSGSPYFFESRARQGKIYQLLLSQNGYPAKKVYFLNLETGVALETPQMSNEWIERGISKMIEMVKKGYFPKQHSKLCRKCPYKLDCFFDKSCLWYI